MYILHYVTSIMPHDCWNSVVIKHHEYTMNACIVEVQMWSSQKVLPGNLSPHLFLLRVKYGWFAQSLTDVSARYCFTFRRLITLCSPLSWHTVSLHCPHTVCTLDDMQKGAFEDSSARSLAAFSNC